MGLDQDPKLHPDLRSAIELQKITILSTAHSNRTVLKEIALICCWDMNLLDDCHLTTNRRE